MILPWPYCVVLLIYLLWCSPLKPTSTFLFCCVVSRFSSMNQFATGSTLQGIDRNEYSGADRSTGLLQFDVNQLMQFDLILNLMIPGPNPPNPI